MNIHLKDVSLLETQKHFLEDFKMTLCIYVNIINLDVVYNVITLDIQ